MIANYDEWLEGVPDSIKNDALWDMDTYRNALFVFDSAWYDCETLLEHPLGKPLARSSGSVPANMEEGFGRGFGKDYARFLRIAIGSARESRGWYYRSHHILSSNVIEYRIDLLDKIIGGLIIMSNQQRNR